MNALGWWEKCIWEWEADRVRGWDLFSTVGNQELTFQNQNYVVKKYIVDTNEYECTHR
jgi:hypothetical protein